MYKQLHLEPYAVHTTFQYAGTEGKRHRLREAMLFFDQPSYYDSPGLYFVHTCISKLHSTFVNGLFNCVEMDCSTTLILSTCYYFIIPVLSLVSCCRRLSVI
jgi:hypothetical protein